MSPGGQLEVRRSVGWSLSLHGDHVWDLALAVAVARHHDEVVQRVRLEPEDAVVDAPVQRDALPDLVDGSLAMQQIVLDATGTGVQRTRQRAGTVQLDRVRVCTTLVLHDHRNWYSDTQPANNSQNNSYIFAAWQQHAATLRQINYPISKVRTRVSRAPCGRGALRSKRISLLSC